MSRSGASFAIAALAAVGALGFVAACKTATGNNCGNSSAAPSLIGTFTLVSYTLGTTTSTPPTASGNLRFHAFTYGVDLSIPTGTGINHNTSDSGSYDIVGASCIQEFSVMGLPSFSGSFQLRADSTFHVSGTANGQVVAGLWKRTS